MAIGIRTIRKIRDLEERANRLGFKFVQSKHYFGSEHTELLALAPLDNCLPVYTRDAELWTGTLEQLEDFFKGIEFSTRYYQQLGLINQKKISRKEQDVRNQQLLAAIQNSSTTDLKGSP